MRFEHAAAYGMGIGLPLLEALRRKTAFSTTVFGYVDDFIAGVLLLYAAWATTRRKPSGPVWLLLAWASLAGGLYGSFFGQLERGAGTDVGGLSNFTVVLIKGVLYAIAIAGAVQSARFLMNERRGRASV